MATLEALMKSLESKDKINTKLPFIIRLDGRTFSNFTKKNCTKPFDQRLFEVFRDITLSLCREFRPHCGYTQSDEISLLFLPSENPLSQQVFDGKIQKLVSVTAGYASSCLMKELQAWKIETESCPHLDSRIFNVPDTATAKKYFWWRYSDCIKNSISMLAQHHFSTNQLHKKNRNEKKAMLRRKQVDWDTDLPIFFRYGVFIVKDLKEVNGVMRKKYGEKLITETDVNDFLNEIVV